MSISRGMSSWAGLRSATSTIRVSGMEDDGELLITSEKAILPHALALASETICLASRTKEDGYDTYLKRTVGISLKECLQQMTEVRPVDPIEYIAQALYKFSDSELYRREKLDFLQKLIVTRDKMREDEARRLEHLTMIKNTIQEQKNLFNEIRLAELDDLMTLLIKYNLPCRDFEKRLLELAEIYGQGDIVRNIMRLKAHALAAGTNRNLERMLGILMQQYEQRAADQLHADGRDPVLGAYKLVNGVKVPMGVYTHGGYEIVNGVVVPIRSRAGKTDGVGSVCSGESEEEEGDSSSDSLVDADRTPRSRRRGSKGGRLPPIPGQVGTDPRETKRQRHLARIRDKIMADMEEGHFLVDRRGQLIFMNNDLGVISPRQPTVTYANPVDNPKEWTAKGFRCETFYEPELYTVCDARPDDWSDYPYVVRMTLSEFTKQKLPPIGKSSPGNSSVSSEDVPKENIQRSSRQSKQSDGSTSSKK